MHCAGDVVCLVGNMVVVLQPQFPTDSKVVASLMVVADVVVVLVVVVAV